MIRKISLRLFELNLEFALPEHAAGEVDHELAVARLPIFDPVATHVGDDDIVQRREFDRVDAPFLHAQGQAVGDEQAGLFESGGDARGDLNDRLDATELHAERERTAIEVIGRERAGGRVDLAQTGRRFGFHQRVLGADCERTGLALDALRLWQRQFAREWSAFDRLF